MAQFCENNTHMYNEFTWFAALCVAGLLIAADFYPVEITWSPDQNPDPEDDLVVNDDNQQANQANTGAPTQSIT